MEDNLKRYYNNGFGYPKFKSKDSRKYWNKLKQRLKEEGNETVTNCHQLELKAQDGKYRLTDVTDIEARLGESVVSKENTLSYKYIEKSKKIENKM